MSLISAMLFAERHLEGGVTAFAGQAAALPGTEAAREASTRGLDHLRRGIRRHEPTAGPERACGEESRVPRACRDLEDRLPGSRVEQLDEPL